MLDLTSLINYYLRKFCLNLIYLNMKSTESFRWLLMESSQRIAHYTRNSPILPATTTLGIRISLSKPNRDDFAEHAENARF